MLKQWMKETYWPIIFAVMGLLLIGSLFIFSASVHDSGSYMSRHLIWTVLGVIVLFATPFLGYRTFLSLSYLLYWAAIVLLIWVIFFGESRLGAQRWIHLGPLVLQPSEFAKLATVIALAHYLGSHPPWENQARVIFTAIGIVLLPCALIINQPDLGSTILFIPIVAVLLLMWGIHFRTLLISLAFGLVTLPLFWTFLKPYQQQRILVFLDPSRDPLGAGYTAIQSKIAVGSGELFGKGYLEGTQSQLQFVPEHHTDFIFCVIGEEWGFFGTMLVLGLYVYLFRAVFLVMTHTTDAKAKLVVAGVLVMLFSQCFINIGMSFGLMPITGLTLPLISYGGSSLVTTAFGLGLILSVYKERSIF